jgi:hypothetical protein
VGEEEHVRIARARLAHWCPRSVGANLNGDVQLTLFDVGKATR